MLLCLNGKRVILFIPGFDTRKSEAIIPTTPVGETAPCPPSVYFRNVPLTVNLFSLTSVDFHCSHCGLSDMDTERHADIEKEVITRCTTS